MYSELCQISKMKRLAKKVTTESLFNYFWKKLHLRYSTWYLNLPLLTKKQVCKFDQSCEFYHIYENYMKTTLLHRMLQNTDLKTICGILRNFELIRNETKEMKQIKVDYKNHGIRKTRFSQFVDID